MKIESFSTPTREIEVSNDDLTVVATPWGNHEGVNVFVHGNSPGLPIRTFFAMRWNEIDVLMVALQAARAEV